MAADIDRVRLAVCDIRIRVFPDGADLNLDIPDKTVRDRLCAADGAIGCDDRPLPETVHRAVDAGDLHRMGRVGFGVGDLPGDDVRAGRLVTGIIARDADAL